jgi:hypothetical protein
MGKTVAGFSKSRVSAKLVFLFKDGSIHEEKTVFSQRGTFRLLISDQAFMRRASDPAWRLRYRLAQGESAVPRRI